MTRALDHGVLNTPIAKRGNIDAQIDTYKRQQARAEFERSRATQLTAREQKARIKELLAAMSDERVLTLAKPLGKRTPATARWAIASAASFRPALWIATLERELEV